MLNQPSKVLVETERVLVRIMTLAPFEVAPMHFHTEMEEHIVCLQGKVSVNHHRAETEVFLEPGQAVTIPVGSLHQVKNMVDTNSQYLLTQSGGRYDFCESTT